MASELRDVPCWCVNLPFSLQTVPTRLEELVCEVQNCQSNYDVPNRYATREAAVQQCRVLLEGQKQQAEADLATATPNPITLGNTTIKNTESLLQEMRSDAEKRLKTAQAGLNLLAGA